jgi:hypothetical protein
MDSGQVVNVCANCIFVHRRQHSKSGKDHAQAKAAGIGARGRREGFDPRK